MAPKQSLRRGRRYESKRNFSASPEPGWQRARRPAKAKEAGRLFVIQKHAARRLHYDLRLEMEGALVSWAVPKGLPMKHGEKHLAVKVEDHPLDYAEFEGNIPAGNYGAGSVMLWDRGLYEAVDADPARALKNGRLTIVLAGEKLRGAWTLVRTGIDGDKENWLLLKGKENDLKLAPADDDRSVATGRSMAEIADESDKPKARRKPPARAARRKEPAAAAELKNLPKKQPAFASPMKPTLSADLPRHGDWLYEIKFDGYRLIGVKDGDEVCLFSRNEKNVTATFPEIADALAALPVDKIVIDGEAVALNKSGISSFQLLQNRGRSKKERPPIFCYAFDLLNLEGKDTTKLPVEVRKHLLEELIDGQDDTLRFSAGIEAEPEFFLAQAEKLGLEGIIAKKMGSSYEIGRRSRSWLKIKVNQQQEFVIGGYTPPKGSRSKFGSVLVGLYEDGEFIYVARVGTGFNQKILEEAFKKFQPLRIDECPFSNLPASSRGQWGGGLTAAEMKRCTWLEPKLVCQIKFSEWTGDDSIRHPVFLGFRDDKSPQEVRREKAG